MRVKLNGGKGSKKGVDKCKKVINRERVSNKKWNKKVEARGRERKRLEKKMSNNVSHKERQNIKLENGKW